MEIKVCVEPVAGLTYDICEAAVPMSDYRDLQSELATLRAEVDRLRAENAELKQDIYDMEMEMRVMGEYE